MNGVFLSKDFNFLNIELNKFHYTDNRENKLHPHYLALLLKGTAKLVTKNETVELIEGDVFYIPLGCSYESYWYGEEIEWISLAFSYFPETQHTDYKIQKIECSDNVKEIITSIPLNQPVTSGALGLFFNALSLLIPNMQTEKKNRNDALFRNARYQLTLHTNWDIPKIAKECGVSESTLYTAFKTVCGKTPNGIRQEILTQKAILMLTTTDKSVEEISGELGFSSTAYFRKILAKTIGKTPREIRKNSSTV